MYVCVVVDNITSQCIFQQSSLIISHFFHVYHYYFYISYQNVHLLFHVFKNLIIVNSSVLLTRIACFVVYLFDMFVSALQFRQPVSCKHSSSAHCHVEAQHYDPPCNVNIVNKIITGNFSMEET